MCIRDRFGALGKTSGKSKDWALGFTRWSELFYMLGIVQTKTLFSRVFCFGGHLANCIMSIQEFYLFFLILPLRNLNCTITESIT